MTTELTAEPIPQHVRPTSLHNLVIVLWVVVGVFTGAGLAAVVGTLHAVRHEDLTITEHVANVGQYAGPWFIAAVVALGAIAVVEAILLTLGHVQHMERELES